MKKYFVLTLIFTLALGTILPSMSLVSASETLNTQVADVIEEEFEVPLIKGIETVGYTKHNSTLTYYADGSFDLVDHIEEYDLENNLIDKYTETSSSKPEMSLSKLSEGTAGGKVTVENEKVKDGKVVESNNSTIYLPSEDELNALLEESKENVNKTELKGEMENLLGQKVTDEMFISEEEALTKIQQINGENVSALSSGGIQRGYGNNYYSYNISNYDYSIQTLSAASHLYFLVSDNRNNLDSPGNWSEAMSKMDDYSQSMVFMKNRKSEAKVGDWLDVVASWLALYGISAGPPGWAAAATGTVITALNSIYKISSGTSTEEAEEAQLAAAYLNDLAKYVIWGYITSDQSDMWFIEIKNTDNGLIS